MCPNDVPTLQTTQLWGSNFCVWKGIHTRHRVFQYRGGENSVREKLCPGEILTGKILSQSLFCPGKILSRPAGSGKYIDWREAPEIFEGNFAYNWSLCVGKIQQSLSWPGKILSQPLKRPEKYCPEIWDRIFPTGVFPGRSFSLPGRPFCNMKTLQLITI